MPLIISTIPLLQCPLVQGSFFYEVGEHVYDIP